VTAALAVGCAVLGLVAGSFLAVVVDRVPRKEPVRAPARCGSCHASGAGSHDVPVLSWLSWLTWLSSLNVGRRCRACRQPLPARNLVLQLGAAALYAGAALRFGADWALPAFLVFLGALLALALIDLEHFLLPNRVIYPTLALSAPLLLLAAVAGHRWHALGTAVLGSALAFGAFFLLNLVYPRGMAFGDVRLSSVIGLYLGWLGLSTMLLGLFLAFLSAALVGILLIVTGRATRDSPIPFGVFLAIGAATAVFAATPILHWYRGG
jgi:leader peptidase (prepilin peptidase)/N-methyltransferase